MDSSVAVLVDAKREYTNQLIQTIRPHLLSGVLHVYDEAHAVCQENKEPDLTMLTFQELLGEVPKWNNVMVNEETARIVDESKCDYLEDLLTAVFVCHTKILTTVRVTNKDRKINLKIPSVENFLHQVYIEMARAFWKHPYLLNPLDVSKLEYQQNLQRAEDLIHDCLEMTVRKLLPVKNILKEYLTDADELDGATDDASGGLEPSNTELVGGGTENTPMTKATLQDDLTKLKTSAETDGVTIQTACAPTTGAPATTPSTTDAPASPSVTSPVSSPPASPKSPPPSTGVFDKMLDAIEGKPSAAASGTQVAGGGSTDVKTIDLSKPSGLTSISSSSPPTLNLSATAPALPSSLSPLSSPTGTTALSLDSLTGGGGLPTSSSVSPPSSPTSNASELSLDNLGGLEQVNVDFGGASSSSSSSSTPPSIQTEVLSEFDKLSKQAPPVSPSVMSTIGGGNTGASSSKPSYTFF